MRHTDTVQAIYEAFGRGDVAAILTRVRDDVSWDNSRVASRDCPWNGNFSGTARLPGFFTALASTLQFQVFRPLSFTEQDNRVLVTLQLESTVVKNGRQLQNEVVHAWTFDEAGKVASYRHYNDTAQEQEVWAN